MAVDGPIEILGAGVAGLCMAVELTGRGLLVRLVDPAGGPGDHHCSWWAGGMLAPFCEGESAEEPVIRYGQAAAAWWSQYTSCVEQAGSLVVTLERDTRELDRFARQTERWTQIDADRIGELEPDLAGRYRKTLFFEGEAHLTPRQALAELLAWLQERGITIEAEPSNNPALTIDCRGLAAQDNLTDLRGVKGEMLVLHCPDVTLNRPIRLLHPRYPLYIVPRGNGVFMLGATQIEAQDRSRITARSMLELLSAAYALHPGFGEASVIEIGVDARPAFPDNLPRIRRRARTDGSEIIFANGLFRHGYLLAPTLACMVADWITQDTTPEFADEDHRQRQSA
ncbi:MAG: FAD-dependent oxidoreductase [Alphaproteobacteria bacterium]|nr:FAD-dependent oxidoreductase [Alphaproteobacteria bacterium SS10]